MSGASGSEIVRIGVLEDDPLMRDYLVQTIAAHPDFTLVFAEATLRAARAAAEAADTLDICLVDLQLPDGNGTDFVRDMRERHGAHALILTVLGDKTSVLSAFQSGAAGYLLKDSAPEQIASHIRQTMSGANPVDAQVSTHLLSAVRGAPESEPSAAPSPLSDRETQVLTLFAKGLSYRESAQTIGVSPNTINHYVKSIYGKLDVNSRNEAVFEAMQQGWITP